ncbi:MAG TPA: M15 family metallopeptidase [Ureibacillus sp.]|nr:M15 family metallopeptidase [Ureibacillus sp.]
MKRHTTISNNNSKKKYIWIGVSVAVILVAAVVVFMYLNQNSVKNEATPKETEENDSTTIEDNNSPTNSEENGETAKPEEQTEEQPLTNNGYIEGQPLPTEPTYVDGILIANKKYPLPSTFAPGENKEARNAFEQMAADAKAAGFELVAFSTYRSYEYQDTLYNNYVSRDGQENADRYSARPGYSEHQTGFAFDIGEVGKEDLWLTEEFGESEAGKWLVENAVNYGFILRYPKGKEAITGYMYESWHFRYLGVDLAAKVKEADVTLEEYLGIQ